MNVPKKSKRTAWLVFLLIVIGLYGCFAKDLVENSKAFWIALRWFSIPVAIFSIYMGWRYSKLYTESKSTGKYIITLLMFVVFIGWIVLESVRGYLVLFNCYVEPQSKITIKGQVIHTQYPRRRTPLTRYRVDVQLASGEVLKLHFSVGDYHKGQPFVKEMWKGSLGLLYGDK